jgi:hypothetical protein
LKDSHLLVSLRHAIWSLSPIIELKAAATQIQDFGVRSSAASDSFRHHVKALPAVPFDVQQSRLAQDSQMFGYIVVGCAETARDLADAKGRFQQEADDAHSRVLAQRPERAHAVEPFEEQQIAPRAVGDASRGSSAHHDASLT